MAPDGSGRRGTQPPRSRSRDAIPAAASPCTVAGSTTRTPGWSGSTTRRPRRGSRRRKPSPARSWTGCRDATGCGRGRSLRAPRAAVAADPHRVARTRVRVAGRRQRREAQAHAATRHATRRSRRCSTRTPGPATRCWSSPCRRRTAALVAFGKAVGGTHDAVIHVLDVETGRVLPDRPRGTNHTSVAWRPDWSAFFYAAGPEPGEVPAGEEALWNAIYEHRLGSVAPARRVFGDDPRKEYWCSVKVSECGRFAVLSEWDFVHANVVSCCASPTTCSCRWLPRCGRSTTCRSSATRCSSAPTSTRRAAAAASRHWRHRPSGGRSSPRARTRC